MTTTNGNNTGEYRKIPIPPHRVTPLRNNWLKIYAPLVEQLKLQVRYNPKIRSVELRTSTGATKDNTNTSVSDSPDSGYIQKGADFVRAFALGFEVDDAVALLRLDDIFMDSFEVKDVKTLSGDHLGRAIGRLAGKGGRTKTTIENASRTRIVLADSKINILGSYRNIRVAKDAIVALIMGSTPGRIYTKLKSVSARLVERN